MSPELLSCLSVFLPQADLSWFTESGAARLSPMESVMAAGPWLAPEDARERLDNARRVQERCDRGGATILYPGHPDYPVSFLILSRPPLFLMMRGAPAWREGQAGLGVVGSRDPSADGVRWLEIFLPRLLRERALFTVSGGARGIDQTCHRLSLRAKAPTVAFLPSGLEHVYPRDLGAWIPEILEGGGAVVTEYPPWTPMRKHHFLARNRLIAALGAVLLVVEARRRSGSYLTGRLALECGREVCVVPGSPLNPHAAGALDLICDGATPVRDDLDLKTSLNRNSRHKP